MKNLIFYKFQEAKVRVTFTEEDATLIPPEQVPIDVTGLKADLRVWDPDGNLAFQLLDELPVSPATLGQFLFTTIPGALDEAFERTKGQIILKDASTGVVRFVEDVQVTILDLGSGIMSNDWTVEFARRVEATDGAYVDTLVDYDPNYEYAFGGFSVVASGSPLISASSIEGILSSENFDAVYDFGGGRMAYSPDGGVTVLETPQAEQFNMIAAGGIVVGMSEFVLTAPFPGASFKYDGNGGFSVKQQLLMAGWASYAVIARRPASR